MWDFQPRYARKNQNEHPEENLLGGMVSICPLTRDLRSRNGTIPVFPLAGFRGMTPFHDFICNEPCREKVYQRVDGLAQEPKKGVASCDKPGGFARKI